MRGDPYLWREMRDRFQDVPLPATVDELAGLIEAAFESLANRPISTGDPVFVARYDHGGMSSGQVSPDFWRDTAIPLLRARLGES